MAEIHDGLTLYITSENFLLEPQDTDERLVIDRVSKEINLQRNRGPIPPGAGSISICGIFGIINLLAGNYLIVITKKSRVGEINGQVIWRVEGTEMFPYAKTLYHLSSEQNMHNRTYLSMIKAVLQTPYFYFSTAYDLTHTLQRLHNTSPEFLTMPLFERTDQRFIWNFHLMKDLTVQPELSRYWLPIIHGFIIIKRCVINQKQFTWALISRRSFQRAGTRFFMRGLDSEGCAANFVETEQIVEYDGCKSSFVQTRGSIPLFWSQYPNLKYKPTPKLNNNYNHLDGFQRHFSFQYYKYGKQVIINLIDHKGAEKTLERALDNHVQSAANPNIRYEPFDFHHECRHMRWERLSILIDRVMEELRDFGYFMILKDNNAISIQEGVFRTNCMDCLDRTNVVQSMLARNSLQHQLKKFGVLEANQCIEDQLDFEIIYKNAWADNADICSIQYAGTGALKTDFTRTGKRSYQGALKDGLNSLIRYFKNNFTDGFRQDSIDLFLGNYQINESEDLTTECPLEDKKDLKILVPPLVLLFAVAIMILSVIFTVQMEDDSTFLFFWFGMCTAIGSLSFIMYHGSEFAKYPKLRQLTP